MGIFQSISNEDSENELEIPQNKCSVTLFGSGGCGKSSMFFQVSFFN